MLSKDMDIINESFKKEKKRKKNKLKDDQSPSKKKQKLNDDKINEPLLFKCKSELDILALANEIEDEYCTSDKETTKSKLKIHNVVGKKSKSKTNKSNKKKPKIDDGKIEEIKALLLNELEDERLRIEELNKKVANTSVSKKETVNTLLQEIEEREAVQKTKKAKTKKIKDKQLEIEEVKKQKKSKKHDKIIDGIKQKLLNELQEEQARIEELNKIVFSKCIGSKQKLTNETEESKNTKEKTDTEQSDDDQELKIEQSEDETDIEQSDDEEKAQLEIEQSKDEIEESNNKNTEEKTDTEQSDDEEKGETQLKIEQSEDDTDIEQSDDEEEAQLEIEQSEDEIEESNHKNTKTNTDQSDDEEREETQLKIKQSEDEPNIEQSDDEEEAQLEIEQSEEDEIEEKTDTEQSADEKEEETQLEIKKSEEKTGTEQSKEDETEKPNIKLSEEKIETEQFEKEEAQRNTVNIEEKMDTQQSEEESEKMDTEPIQTSEELAIFDPKKFLKLLLNKQTCYGALKEFIELCSKDQTDRDFALEYLKNGGGTSEIIRVIEIAENKTASFVLPIVEALTMVVLKILFAQPQKQAESAEPCREFINKHYSVIKAMIALNSTSKQRKSALKMLSAIVSLSASCAKEVLSHAVFDQAVLEILYQPSNVEDGSNVRTHFIHFLISFLVDGHTAVIIAFLEKRALLSSIFPGLLYDTVDIVNLVLSTIQLRILEDKAISKTTKMNLFTTQNIQTIIGLFNWRGPRGWNPKKRKEISITTDPQQLGEVRDTVLKFLTCLCASKHGIIFFDPTVGLSAKKYNPLLLTVLNGLAKPWMEPHKKELVVKICVACPDLLKTVLASVEVLSAPRISDSYVSAVHFVKELIESLTPAAIEQFLLKLSNKQASLVIQQLCVPHIILNKIMSGMEKNDIKIRYECVLLLHAMLNSVGNYLLYIPKIPGLNETVIRYFLSGYLSRCLPLPSFLLKDWYDSIKSTDIDKTKLNEYLVKLLDILYQYNTFCPGSIENITQGINIKKFLRAIDVLNRQGEKSYDLHIKAINLLISCDVTIFAPSKKYFSYALPLLLKFYYRTNGDTQIAIEKMLFTLFKLTSIFDCCPDEIMIWLYSILDQSNYNKTLAVFLTEVLVHTRNDFLKYSNEMASLKEQLTEGYNYRVIIENLSHLKTLKSNITQSKHRILSPFILGFLDLLLERKIDIKSYVNISLMNLLHYQTNPMICVNIVLQEKYGTIVEGILHKYFSIWKLNEPQVNKKDPKPINTIYHKLIQFLTIEDISEMPKLIKYISEHLKYYTNTITTNLIMFYYTQKSHTNSLERNFQTKCYQLLMYIISNSDERYLNDCLKSIFDHPLMLESFSPTFIKTESNQLSTELVVNIVNELLKKKTKSEINIYLGAYQTKLVEEIFKLLEDYSEKSVTFQVEQLMDIIKLFDLSHENCGEILNIISKLPVSSFKADKMKSLIILKLQSFILSHESNYSHFQPFSNEILKQINQQMIELNNTELNLEELELNLCNYIKQFPHVNINFSAELFESLITKSTITKSSVRLATILLQKNHKYLDIFAGHLDKLCEKRELVFSLTNSVMNQTNDVAEVKKLLEKVHKHYEQIIMKYLNKPQKAANYLVENHQVINKLVGEHLKHETCKVFCSTIHKFDSTEIHHFETLTIIFNKIIVAESSEDLKQKYVTNYITTSMNLLINLLKRATKTEDDWTRGEKVAKHFCTYLIRMKNVYNIQLKEVKLYSGAVFQTFAKLCLKFGLQDKPVFVNVLKHLCALLMPQEASVECLGVLFEMAISHSESLNILLSDDEKKAPLLSLLLTLCKQCKSVMIKSHIPIWLSAYEATLSETDQCLLQLLSMYESANIGFHEYRPYLWGKAAVAHYSVRSSIETILWRQPKPKEVLDLFNENRIIHTVRNFPWTRQLHNNSLYSDSDIEVYDPAFYLPLLSHLLAPESTIRWYQCTQRGIISLPIIALTSENEGIRAAACNVLARFHGHLEAATYAKQRFLWLHLIEAVCRGTSVLPSLRPCTIVAVFLARCSIIFTRPDHPLYSTLGNYISAKECPNFNIVPELLNMLHSTDVNHIEHRNFILEVIRDGLCTEQDLKVLYKSVAFKLIMDLYNSILTDDEAKKIILEILAAAVTIKNGARTLVSSYNIISWLHLVLQRFKSNAVDLLYVFIKIINNLITSFEDDLFNHLQFNILLLLISVIDIFKSSRLELIILVKYVQVLYKVYDKKPNILTRTQLLNLLSMCSSQLNCQVCNYYLDFGTDFVETPTLVSDDVETVGCYYLKMLTLKWIQTNKEL